MLCLRRLRFKRLSVRSQRNLRVRLRVRSPGEAKGADLGDYLQHSRRRCTQSATYRLRHCSLLQKEKRVHTVCNLRIQGTYKVQA